MSGNVFANGMEISSKASGNKSIAAMPDVCMSPPSPPAGPIPIPYPNTATTSDTTDGSKSVQIKGKEVHLKNKSSYKKSNGNQPATNNFGANIITHQITGAMKFAAWSFNVKVEGQNVVRFMDLTTHNHANSGGGATTSSVADMVAAQNAGKLEDVCDALAEANQDVRTQKALTEKNTVAHALFTAPNGVSRVLKAVSSGAKVKYDNSFCTGLSRVGLGKEGREKRFKKKGVFDDGKIVSRVCGESYTYPSGAGNFRHTCSHAESRIIETISAVYPNKDPDRRAKLVLSIDWPNSASKGKKPWDPCENCEKLLCAASKCMDIQICIKEDKKPTREPACESP